MKIIGILRNILSETTFFNKSCISSQNFVTREKQEVAC